MSRTHVVAPGESLPQIAQDSGVTIAEIVAANPALAAPGATPTLTPGATVVIPDPAFAPQVDTRTGDTCCPASANFVGVLLWPAWRAPVDATPPAERAQTGVVTNHYRYVPGVLDLAATPPVWRPAEQLVEASYEYDATHPGDPLPGVQVDLHPAAAGNLDEYPGLRAQPRLASTQTDASGRFGFTVDPGEYLLALRGRFAFIPTPDERHNGVRLLPLQGAAGAPWLHLRVTVTAEAVTFRGANGQTPVTPPRDLARGQTAADVRPPTPYRFHALPIVCDTHAGQWDACVEALRRAFNVTPEQALRAMRRTPVLDLEALARWPLEAPPTTAAIVPTPPPPAPGVSVPVAADDLLKRTLLLAGEAAATTRTAAYDHAFWSFAAVEALTRTRARFVPLGEDGLFSGADHLYGLATRTKDTYGRYALRHTADGLEGRDIRELKIRLILWGSRARWVDLRDDRFDPAVREALVRFKAQHELLRHTALDAAGALDPARSSIVAIVDGDTHAALDATEPAIRLDAVTDREDTAHPGVPQLTAEGYSRLVLYAASIAHTRVGPQLPIHIHSSFRTLDHNRRVYLGNHNLHWRLASGAPTESFERSGFTTEVGGVRGADGSAHAAGAAATATTVRYGEPRGTYVGGPHDYWAADYSRHTTGRALDFCFRPSNPVHPIPQIQRDTDALRLFGAVRSEAHAAGQLWLEPRSIGASTWIHLDSGDIPAAREELVLTDDAARGPRWDATVIARGRVVRDGVPVLGARVRLVRGEEALDTAYTDIRGEFSVRARQVAVTDSYALRVDYDGRYPFQPPTPAVLVTAPEQAVISTYPGEEVAVADVALGAAAPP